MYYIQVYNLINETTKIDFVDFIIYINPIIISLDQVVLLKFHILFSYRF